MIFDPEEVARANTSPYIIFLSTMHDLRVPMYGDKHPEKSGCFIDQDTLYNHVPRTCRLRNYGDVM